MDIATIASISTIISLIVAIIALIREEQMRKQFNAYKIENKPLFQNLNAQNVTIQTGQGFSMVQGSVVQTNTKKK